MKKGIMIVVFICCVFTASACNSDGGDGAIALMSGLYEKCWGKAPADVLGQLGMAEDDFTVTVSTTTNNDHDQEVRRYEALEPMIVSGEQTGNVALEFLDGQLALCSVVVGYTRDQGEEAYQLLVETVRCYDEKYPRDSEHVPPVSEDDLENYETFSERTILVPSFNLLWNCDDETTLYLSYSNGQQGIVVRTFYIRDISLVSD